jgi:hypothetical protein
MILARGHFRILITILALPLLFAGERMRGDDQVLCKEGFLQVVSPDVQIMSPEQCGAVLKMSMAAWRFDADQIHWADLTELETPLTLQLISVDRMKAEHAGLLGFAKGRDLFVVSTAVLDDPFANGTLAHELAHIQANRALGKFYGKQAVPRYFVEGHGNILGRAYRDQIRVENHDYDARKARQIMKITTDEARTILTDNSYGATDKREMDKMEAMGIFFVEHMRVRHHRTGLPDMVPRMGRVFELVGHGRTYESAFKDQFGSSVDEVVSEIVEFFKITALTPAERLKGTRYEEWAGPASAAAPGRITKAVLGTDRTHNYEIVNPRVEFPPDTPQVVCIWKSEDVKPGTPVRAVWIAEDVGAAAPPNTKIDEITTTSYTGGSFNLTKPNKGWPVGRYRLEIYLGKELAKTVPFAIKAP